MSIPKTLCICVFLPFFLASDPLRANPGNSERYPVGARTIGMGGVGTAFMSTPWHNLAGLGHADEEGLSGSLSAYGFSVENVKSAVDDGDIKGSLNSSSVDIFPASLAYVKPLGTIAGIQHGVGVSVVVANFDQFDGVLEAPSDNFAFDLRLARQALEQTTWMVAGWGGCLPNQKFCVGMGPAAALHQQSDLTVITVEGAAGGEVFSSASTSKREFMALAVGAQLGMQARVLRNVWIGASLRTPVKTLFSSGSFLGVESVSDSEAGAISYIDRAEIHDPIIDFRQPWRIKIGLGYKKEKDLTFGADLRITTAQGRHNQFAAANGAERVAPVNVLGESIADPEREIFVGDLIARDVTYNFNVGLEKRMTEKLAVQAGVFSDISSTFISMVQSGEMDNRISRYGTTLGLGLHGSKSTTWLSLLGAYGSGQSAGFGEDFSLVTTGVRSWSVFAMLGSRAVLSD